MANTASHDTAEAIERDIRAQLEPTGLIPLGWFGAAGYPALLVGNVGSSLWSAFSASNHFSDGQPDPMNRWTEATISALVERLPGGMVDEVRYPFGEPNWPFQDYARQALNLRQSPIGLMVHPKFGLWTAFRAVLIFARQFDYPAPVAKAHPCDTCPDKPCLSTCPIGAFAADGYDYRSCKSHVGSPAGHRCFESGCLARRSCPVGQDYVYEDAHQNFHMKAYT